MRVESQSNLFSLADSLFVQDKKEWLILHKTQRGLWLDTTIQATQETTAVLIEIYFSLVPCWN